MEKRDLEFLLNISLASIVSADNCMTVEECEKGLCLLEFIEKEVTENPKFDALGEEDKKKYLEKMKCIRETVNRDLEELKKGRTPGT